MKDYPLTTMSFHYKGNDIEIQEETRGFSYSIYKNGTLVTKGVTEDKSFNGALNTAKMFL